MKGVPSVVTCSGLAEVAADKKRRPKRDCTLGEGPRVVRDEKGGSKRGCVDVLVLVLDGRSLADHQACANNDEF